VFFSFQRPTSKLEAERLFAIAEFGNAGTFVSQIWAGRGCIRGQGLAEREKGGKRWLELSRSAGIIARASKQLQTLIAHGVT
jgi:hypothetical protein